MLGVLPIFPMEWKILWKTKWNERFYERPKDRLAQFPLLRESEDPQPCPGGRVHQCGFPSCEASRSLHDQLNSVQAALVRWGFHETMGSSCAWSRFLYRRDNSPVNNESSTGKLLHPRQNPTFRFFLQHLKSRQWFRIKQAVSLVDYSVFLGVCLLLDKIANWLGCKQLLRGRGMTVLMQHITPGLGWKNIFGTCNPRITLFHW